jgi:hypothetical protein
MQVSQSRKTATAYRLKNNRFCPKSDAIRRNYRHLSVFSRAPALCLDPTPAATLQLQIPDFAGAFWEENEASQPAKSPQNRNPAQKRHL